MSGQAKTTGYTPEPGDTDADRLDAALAEIERLRAALRRWQDADPMTRQMQEQRDRDLLRREAGYHAD